MPSKARAKTIDFKAAIEKHPIAVVLALVFSATTAVAGIISTWSAREIELKKAELEQAFRLKQSQLDEERNRIQISIGSETKSVVPERLFVPLQQLPAGYSVAEGGVFAVPRIATSAEPWTWQTRSELDLLVEAAGGLQQLVKSLPESDAKQLQVFSGRLKVLCYESAASIPIEIQGESLVIRPRAFFRRLTWSDFTDLATARNAAAVKGLFEWIQGVSDSTYGTLELAVTFSPDVAIKAIDSSFEAFTRQAALKSLYEPSRVILLTNHLKAAFPIEFSSRFVDGMAKQLPWAREEKARRDADKAKREVEPTKVEPNRLETFVGLFSELAVENPGLGPLKPTSYSFNTNSFSVQGYFELPPASKSKVQRIYVLRVAVMRQEGVYLLGFIYPFDGSSTDLKELMSLVDGVRVIT